MNPVRTLLAAMALVAANGAAALDASVTLTLLHSDTNRRLASANPIAAAAPTEAWLQFATRHRLDIEQASFEQLASLPPGAIAIAPAAAALSEPERQGLLEATRRGVHLLATGAIGSRDASGEPVGNALMRQLFDAQIVGSIGPDAPQRYLQISANTPVSHRLAPLQRLILPRVDEPLLLAVAPYPIARYADWARATQAPMLTRAAASIHEKDGSRRVWIGFPESSWSGSQAQIDRLLLDALDWMTRRPAAALSHWPAPFQAAFLVEMDSELKFGNAQDFADDLTRRGMRGTFYCVTSDAATRPEVVRRLARDHEVAFHADVHDGFKGLPRQEQEERVRRMIAQMLPLHSGTPASGFRAPMESFDDTTEIVLRANGIRHHASSPDSGDVALPSFSSAEGAIGNDTALVVLPRTLPDDINLLALNTQDNTISAALLRSTNVIINAGGFGLLSVHTQNYDAGSVLRRELQPVLDELQAQKDRVWIASGDQIERWWRARTRVAMTSRFADGELQIVLNVSGQQPVGNLQLILFGSGVDQKPEISSALTHTVRPIDRYRAALVLPELSAGEHRIAVRY